MKIHKKIERLIPYIGNDFISYPLWEEGIFLPFIKTWVICKDPESETEFLQKALEIVKDNYDFETTNYKTIIEIRISPNFKYTDDGGYIMTKNNWSIEDMLDILIELLTKN